MPRECRRLAFVAGLVTAVAVAVLSGPVVDGRRWEVARPTVAERTGSAIDSMTPLGRRWD
jgi:hypothetical protein